MNTLKTTIGLEIHVQLKTKSKMFCRCDNSAEGKAPNTVVCPVCLGLPGALPVANKQAIEWTIKAGLAIDSQIPKIAKFDRKHYFYPDLPKGYQISQYDEPFCIGGAIEIGGQKIRFNRIHLEEDAGKLIHADGKSLVDLNRAGTPLMEMVTEPDITSPKTAGDFLRRLQKLVRDEVKVSDADMEKGHMRCDANISITDGERMSEIVEIKNLNSFRFVEKALALEEERLKSEYPNWPEKKGKVTRGYDSENNITYVQRTKEEAADYRYFPEPDLPPFDSSVFDLESLRLEIGQTEETVIDALVSKGIAETEAKVLARDKQKMLAFEALSKEIQSGNEPLLARIISQNYFGFTPREELTGYAKELAKLIEAFASNKISKPALANLANEIKSGKTFEDALEESGGVQVGGESEIGKWVSEVLEENPNEAAAYKNGKTQLLGFFVGAVMRKSRGRANPEIVNKLLKEYLEG